MKIFLLSCLLLGNASLTQADELMKTDADEQFGTPSIVDWSAIDDIADVLKQNLTSINAGFRQIEEADGDHTFEAYISIEGAMEHGSRGKREGAYHLEITEEGRKVVSFSFHKQENLVAWHGQEYVDGFRTLSYTYDESNENFEIKEFEVLSFDLKGALLKTKTDKSWAGLIGGGDFGYRINKFSYENSNTVRAEGAVISGYFGAGFGIRVGGNSNISGQIIYERDIASDSDEFEGGNYLADLRYQHAIGKKKDSVLNIFTQYKFDDDRTSKRGKIKTYEVDDSDMKIGLDLQF